MYSSAPHQMALQQQQQQAWQQSWPGSKSSKCETYFDPSTGLERRRRVGGSETASKTQGTKREVWNGTAEKTSGGLTIDKLGKNKRGHIVSVAKYLQGKKRIAQLAQSPYFGRVQDLAQNKNAGGRTARSNARTTATATANQQTPQPLRFGGAAPSAYQPAPPQLWPMQPASFFPPLNHLPFPPTGTPSAAQSAASPYTAMHNNQHPMHTFH